MDAMTLLMLPPWLRVTVADRPRQPNSSRAPKSAEVRRVACVLVGARAGGLGRKVADVQELSVFDCRALFAALDAQRQEHALGWYELADLLWEQSADLNARRPDDHPLCGGAVQRLSVRGATSCQYALFMLRWLDRAPEDFLSGSVRDVGDTSLPRTSAGHRLRWDLRELHTALNAQRQQKGLTWADLAAELDCTPTRLTNLRNARLADMTLAMRITQWLGRPAAAFIHPADW
jgi:hypothetical protein